MARLVTTSADFAVKRDYEVLRAIYGYCPHVGSRPSYMRYQVDCMAGGESVHRVVHVVQCYTNLQGGPMVARDLPFFAGMFSRLERLPSERAEIVVCDLNAFLCLTKQRRIVNTVEMNALKAVRKIESPVPIVAKLGDYAFSRELCEYIDSLIDHNQNITPDFRRLGVQAKAHMARVEAARKELGLWK